MAMWRRQDEPKASASSPDTMPSPQSATTPSRIEPPATSAAVTVPAAASAPAPPAGHLTISHTIRGEISGREDLYVDGEVEGKVHLEDAKIVIGPNGRLAADVEAREILVLGKVKGNLHGRDSVTIGRTGHVIGDVVTRYISVEDGAQVQGSLDVTRTDEAAQRITPINDKAKAQYAD
jgi:cytoskeletal protein CcmA (bactofilin family)